MTHVKKSHLLAHKLQYFSAGSRVPDACRAVKLVDFRKLGMESFTGRLIVCQPRDS
jgi:hypothetical protein